MFFGIFGAKSNWPKVVGKSGEEAKNIILKDDPSIDVRFIPQGSIVTTDYRTNRVRVYVDANGIVVQTPKRG